MQDNDWLREGFNELKSIMKEIKDDINDMKIESIKHKNDIDSAHTKLRAIEDVVKDVVDLKPRIIVLEQSNNKGWIRDTLNDGRKALINATCIFLMIFLPMSCSNIKKSAEQTVQVITSQSLNSRDSSK